MKQDQIYRKARKKVEARIGFLIHLLVYIMVNTLLIGINLVNSNEVLWFSGPLLGWGIGIFFHGLGVLIFPKLQYLKEGWIKKEMAMGRLKN